MLNWSNETMLTVATLLCATIYVWLVERTPTDKRHSLVDLETRRQLASCMSKASEEGWAVEEEAEMPWLLPLLQQSGDCAFLQVAGCFYAAC